MNNSKKTFFLLSIVMLTLFSCDKDDEVEKVQGIKDGSGNSYTEIILGSQTWLKEDLKASKYTNSQDISDRHFTNKDKEGYYYSYDIDMKKICPKGYRVPTQQDFQILINYSGGEGIDESSIVANYVTKWNGNPNGNGDGLTNIGSGLYWSSTKTTYPGKEGNYYFYFRTQLAGLSVSQYSALSQFHIKCIKE